MMSKPDHLGPEFAAQFEDASVVAAYHLRPPYQDGIFDVLTGLIADRPRIVLDAGAGTGEIARPLAARVDRVDAVDPSRGMIAKGRRLPGGDGPSLRWINETAEAAILPPPYALITAAASLHWMDWEIALPRFRDLLTPRGVFAVIEDREHAPPWVAPLGQLIAAFSTNRAYRPYNVIVELETRGLFRRLGRHETPVASFRQSVDDYVESFHARNGCSRDRMRPERAAAFDRRLRSLVTPFAPDGIITRRRTNEIVWGLPAPRQPSSNHPMKGSGPTA